ncbi:MAG: lytic transglycosylase domain-containing protein [Bacteroidetes bacterium]|nr:MAG: lytic transglycosylase domain-containing protein [Bacteroidota bacterium]
MRKTVGVSLLLIVLSLVLVKYFTFSSDTEEDNDNYQRYFNKSYKVFAIELPDSISFCDEVVPTDMVDIEERLDREMLVNSYWQSQTLLFFKRANKYFPVIEPILKEKGVPDDFKYIALIESGLTNIVSPAGASGYWHFLKKTAQQYNLEVNDAVDERYNLEKSTIAFCDYILEANSKFNNWTLAAASYNMGMTGIQKQINRQKVNNYYDLLLNDETGRYVFRILAVKEILSNPQKYGFHFRPKDLYQPYDYSIVEVDYPIESLVNFSQENGINYKILKELNPWLRRSNLPNTKGNSYEVKIATKGLYSITQPSDSI